MILNLMRTKRFLKSASSLFQQTVSVEEDCEAAIIQSVIKKKKKNVPYVCRILF